MIWKGCFTVLLSLTACMSAPRELVYESKALEDSSEDPQNSTDTATHIRSSGLTGMALRLSEIVAKCFSHFDVDSLQQAKNVCKIWRELANKELEKVSKIVCINSATDINEKNLKVLRNFKNTHNKECGWRPKLLLFFQTLSFESWFMNTMMNQNVEKSNKQCLVNLLGNLATSDVKCFAAQALLYAPGLELRLSYNAQADWFARLDVKNSFVDCCILPEALLRNIGADLIVPPMNMFESRRRLFCKKPAANMQLFADYFGWKVQMPIKLAIIFSRETRDFPATVRDHVRSIADIRAKQVCRWLRSLPKGKQILTINVPECNMLCTQENDGDVAVLLFGGDAMFVDSFIGVPNEIEKQLKGWKTNVIDKWPQTLQKISFLFENPRGVQFEEPFRHIFGNEMQLIVLPKFDIFKPPETYQRPEFVAIGFPKY